MSQNRILIIIPYFGSFPSWFSYYLISCANNPQIDWMLYTDQTYTHDLPDNVTIRTVTFADYCQKVSNNLKINFQPQSPYKLCDLKPCLAAVHPEDVTEYEFWGFGDIDVIYGDLASYIDDAMLSHDLISFHKHRISGHLCLLRNTEKMNWAFKRFKRWQEILEDPQHRCFDEKDFNAIFMKHKNWPEKLRRVIYCYDSYMRNAFFKESYSTHFSRNVEWIDGSQNFPKQWLYNGRVIADNEAAEEIPYLHFMEWKRHWPKDEAFKADASAKAWTINEQGFFNSDLA